MRNHFVRVIGIAFVAASLAQIPLAAVSNASEPQGQGQQGQGQQGQGLQGSQGSAPAESPRVALKLVVERLEGQKTVSSIPFELLVKSGPRTGSTTLNHGRSVAVPQTTFDRDRTATTT